VGSGLFLLWRESRRRPHAVMQDDVG